MLSLSAMRLYACHMSSDSSGIIVTWLKRQQIHQHVTKCSETSTKTHGDHSAHPFPSLSICLETSFISDYFTELRYRSEDRTRRYKKMIREIRRIIFSAHPWLRRADTLSRTLSSRPPLDRSPRPCVPFVIRGVAGSGTPFFKKVCFRCAS